MVETGPQWAVGGLAELFADTMGAASILVAGVPVTLRISKTFPRGRGRGGLDCCEPFFPFLSSTKLMFTQVMSYFSLHFLATVLL